jgi:hypothetical protein
MTTDGTPDASTDSDNLGGTDNLPPQDTGSAVPPYEGRRESADVDASGASAHREGANVAGATGLVEDDEMKAPDSSDTPRGAVASPADEQPATPGGAPAEDEGVGPSHSVGQTRAEDQS